MKISNEVRIGIIFVATLAIFIWGLNYLKGLNIIKKSNSYYAIYDNIGGLTVSNPIIVSGYQVGQVENISFTNEHKLLVKIHIQKDFNIPLGSIAKVYSSDLMGSKAIEIIPSQNENLHKEGDTLSSSIEQELIEQISDGVFPIKNKAENIMTKFDSLLTVLTSTKSKYFIGNSLSNIHSTTESLNRAFVDLESLVRNLNRNNEKINSILSNLKNVSDSIAMSEIKETIANANKSLFQIDSLLNKVNNGEGSIGKLINNDSLYINLENASMNLNLLLEDVKKNPKRYVSISLFGGGKNKE